MFLANVTSYLCARYGAKHRSVSELVKGLSLEGSTLAYYIQFTGAQKLHAVQKRQFLDVKKWN